MATFTRILRLSGAGTGLVTGVPATTLQYRILDASGTILAGLSGTGVSESPAGGGDYRVAAAIDYAWSSIIVEWWTTAGTVFVAAEEINLPVLATNGLDGLPVGDVAGRATSFRTMLVQLWMRFFNRVDQNGTTQTVYQSDSLTPSVSGPVSDDGVTATKGKLA